MKNKYMNFSKILLLAVFCSSFGLSVWAQPANLYIIGGPFNAHKNNWIFRDIVPMEKDNVNPYVFYYHGYIGYNTYGDEPGNFKILTSNNSWDGYHPDGTSNQLIGSSSVGATTAIRLGGDDTKWEIPADRTADGYYSIKIDTEHNTFLVESFTPASCPEYPVGMFAVGGPFIIDNGGWSPDEALKLERDPVDPYIFHYRGVLEFNQWGNEEGNFKILINERGWTEAFHPGGTNDNVLLSSAIHHSLPIRFQGADNKWQLPSDREGSTVTGALYGADNHSTWGTYSGAGNGYWEFSLNTRPDVMTMTVDNFVQEKDYIQHLYLTGDAFSCGWDNSNAEVMNKVSGGIYSWTGNVNAGEFKVLKNKGSWNGSYVATTAAEAVDFTNGNTVVYERNTDKVGDPKDHKFTFVAARNNVKITIDLNTFKMMVSDATTGTGNVEPSSVNVFTTGRKLLVNGVAGKNYTVQVYTVDGRQIMQKLFAGNAEMELQRGCYLVSVADKTGIAIKTKVTVY